MPEDEKSGEPAAPAAPVNPQLSEAEMEAAITKVLDKRIPGLMSGFQKQVNDAVSKSGVTAPNDDKKPLASLTPEERALRLREEAVATKEREVTQKVLAAEYAVPPENVTGATETEMRLAATTYLLAHPKVVTAPEPKPAPRVNSPAQGGNPPGGGGSALTPLEKIQRGLAAKTKT